MKAATGSTSAMDQSQNGALTSMKLGQIYMEACVK